MQKHRNASTALWVGRILARTRRFPQGTVKTTIYRDEGGLKPEGDPEEKALKFVLQVALSTELEALKAKTADFRGREKGTIKAKVESGEKKSHVAQGSTAIA